MRGVDMRKKQSIIVISLLFLVIICFWARPHSRFLLTILPPAGLYSPLMKQPISLKTKTTFSDLKLTHKYVGTYLVGIYIKKSPPYGTPVASNAELNLTIKNNSNLLFEEKFSRWANRFGGPGKEEAGIILGHYKVPDNIPIGIDAQATISITSPDPAFENSYGDLEFFIQRKSDQ